MYLVTAQEMQAMDRETIETFGIPGQVLMENAGKGAFEMLLKQFPHISSKRVAVLAGRGNNGGDGFVIARYLLNHGIAASVFLLSEAKKVTGDAKANLILFERLTKALGTDPIVEIKNQDDFTKQKSRIVHHDLFVDAILGTGLNSDVRGFFKTVIKTLNSTSKPIFSIDIPSGLNSDTGKKCGSAIRASATATFGFAKAGHFLNPGSDLTGRLGIIDIGIPGFIAETKSPGLSLITKTAVGALFQPRDSQSHKGSFGHLLILAGARGKSGAAALASNAAVSSGTGLVTLGVPESLNPVMEPQVTETMTLPLPDSDEGCFSKSAFNAIKKAATGKSCMAIGPGIGTNEGTKKLVQRIVSTVDLPLILDADALNCMNDAEDLLKKITAPRILTPHPGEMARLCHTTTKEIQENRIDTARSFAARFKVILILKGNKTVIALPDGRTWLCPTGNPGMAAGGMGDVLTGMVAGFTAQGFSPENAAISGVYIHGLCGDILAGSRGAFGYTASEMIPTIPSAIDKELL